MQVRIAQTDIDIQRCFPVMVQLRPHLEESDFVPRIRRMMQLEYSLAFIERESLVQTVAGFRLVENLAWGRFLYIDDFVTDANARSQGLGSILFDWCRQFAVQQHCETLLLDSGVQRHDAHRFYLSKRMSISSHHFSMDLK
ncbi:MAG: GNAT family N-acetyltransferase [Candidatus Competibacteraceae bacterium]